MFFLLIKKIGKIWNIRRHRNEQEDTNIDGLLFNAHIYLYDNDNKKLLCCLFVLFVKDIHFKDVKKLAEINNNNLNPLYNYNEDINNRITFVKFETICKYITHSDNDKEHHNRPSRIPSANGILF